MPRPVRESPALLQRSGGYAADGIARAPRARRGCSETEFESWLAIATERADPFMAWLGLLFALAVGYDLAVDLTRPYERALAAAGWLIWAVFVADFSAKLWIAPSKRRFLRRHWLAVAMLLVPALRVLRFASLLRLGRALPAARVISSSYRVGGTAKQLLRSRLWYLAAVVTIAGLASAELVFVFERGSRGFITFGDALTWGFSAVIGMQADPVPRSAGGRLVMIASFSFALVVVAAFAGSLGAFFVKEREERTEDAEARRPS